jgi:hypothetical protein
VKGWPSAAAKTRTHGRGPCSLALRSGVRCYSEPIRGYPEEVPNGVAYGRNNGDFSDGAVQVREPQFSSQSPVVYKRTSVLDNLKPTGNGLAPQDLQRQLVGYTKSTIGQSEGTFDQALWLRQQQTPAMYQQNQNANFG